MQAAYGIPAQSGKAPVSAWYEFMIHYPINKINTLCKKLQNPSQSDTFHTKKESLFRSEAGPAAALYII